MKNRTIIGIVCILLALVLSFVVVPQIAAHSAKKATEKMTVAEQREENHG